MSAEAVRYEMPLATVAAYEHALWVSEGRVCRSVEKVERQIAAAVKQTHGKPHKL
jgi:hypothetical protein